MNQPETPIPKEIIKIFSEQHQSVMCCSIPCTMLYVVQASIKILHETQNKNILTKCLHMVYPFLENQKTWRNNLFPGTFERYIGTCLSLALLIEDETLSNNFAKLCDK